MVMMESEKQRDPTMERPSKEEEEEEEEEEGGKGAEDKPQQKPLQQEWDSIKKPNPRILRRSATDSSDMAEALHFVDNSPRSLLSSLQQERSPPSEVGGGAWKVRNNDLAVEEILRERRAAIRSGKLKGRRLFQEVESQSEMGFEGGREEVIVCSGWVGLVQEDEVRSVCSYCSDRDGENQHDRSEEGLFPPVYGQYCCSCSSSSSPSSFVCDECRKRGMVLEEGEKVVAVVSSEENGKRAVNGVCGFSTRSIVAIRSWLALGLLVCGIGVIISMRSFGSHEDRTQKILHPT